MKKVILFLSILFLLLIQSVSAQNNFSVTISGSYIHFTFDKGILPYWENGFIANVHSEYILSDNFSVFILSSYQQHIFNRNLLSGVAPDVLGYRDCVSGENSSVFEFSVGPKFFTPKDSKIIRPYFSMGIGILFIDQGKVEKTIWMEGTPHIKTNVFADQNFFNVALNYGLGIEIEFINNLNLVIDGKFVHSFYGLTYFPLSAGIKFGL
jgi:hypothetical protein